MKSGAEELYASVQKALGRSTTNHNDDSDNDMAVEGEEEDSFETISQEDISDDEEMKD